MVRRSGKSGARRPWRDPGQLGLFEDRAPPAAAALKTRAQKAAPIPSAAPVRSAVLSPREAAAYLNVSVSTLKAWRAQKIGPAWRRRGARLISYFPADLDAFLAGGARNQRRD